MIDKLPMNDALKRKPARQVTKVSLNPDHLEAARELGIDISQACERGLIETIAKERGARWKEANREAVDSHNAYVAEFGLPLEKYRLF